MDIIKRLPEELRRYILTFTYKPQPTSLTNDIRNYVNSRKFVQDWYYKESGWQYLNAEIDWFHNDLISFCNEFRPTMLGYRDHFFNIFSRMYTLKNKSREQIIHICNNISSTRGSNITWGIMTIEERGKFFEEFINSVG
uniref:Uncharacterized protein n=1 Tax=viral metagenome TaxID=1070528 RepID=A0A6C0HRB7_9ZZZZ